MLAELSPPKFIAPFIPSETPVIVKLLGPLNVPKIVKLGLVESPVKLLPSVTVKLLPFPKTFKLPARVKLISLNT